LPIIGTFEDFFLMCVEMSSLSSFVSSTLSAPIISPISVSGVAGGEGSSDHTPHPGELSLCGLGVNLASYDSFKGATERRTAGPCVPSVEGFVHHSPLLHNQISIPSGSLVADGSFLENPSFPSSSSPSSSSSSSEVETTPAAASSSSSSSSASASASNEKKESETETEEDASVVEEDSGVKEKKEMLSVLKRECYVVSQDESGKRCYECKLCGEKIGKNKHLLDFFKHYAARHRESFGKFESRFFEGISKEAARFCLKTLQGGGSEEVLSVLKELSKFAVATPLKKKEMKEKEKNEGEKKEEKQQMKRREISDGKEEVVFIQEKDEERVKVIRDGFDSELVEGIVEVGSVKLKQMERGVEDIGTTIDGAVQMVLFNGDLEEHILQNLK